MSSSTTRIPLQGQFLTVGYEGRTLPEFVALLRINRVDMLVDVRENAVSRKPGFSKRRLTEALEDAGIEYRHEPKLGNPKDNRAGFRTGSIDQAKRRYLEHLDNGAGAVLAAVVELTVTKRVALLCFERSDAHCHRACIVDRARQSLPSLAVSRL